jgi:integrase
MPRLTESKAKAAALPTDGNQRFVWCSEVNGFGVRVTDGGVRSYVVQTRVNGKPVRKTLGRVDVLPWEGTEDAPGALDLAKLAISAARRGTEIGDTLGKSAAQTFTLQQAWDAYAATGFPIQGQAQKEGTLKAAGSIKIETSLWRCHLVKLASKPVASLTDTVVRLWCDAIVKHSGIGARNQSLRTLLAVVKFARTRGLCETPVITVKAGKGNSVQNYLTPDELKRVDAACVELAALEPNRATGYHVIRVLLHTGARKSEILGLRRDLADLDNKTVKLAHDKGNGNRGRTILLSDKAVEILRALPTYGRSVYFFPSRIDGQHYCEVDDHKVAAFKRAGVKSVRLHDLRHSFASAAISNGVELYTVGKLLGHRDYKSTLVYAHLSDAAARAGADKVANVLA